MAHGLNTAQSIRHVIAHPPFVVMHEKNVATSKELLNGLIGPCLPEDFWKVVSECSLFLSAARSNKLLANVCNYSRFWCSFANLLLHVSYWLQLPSCPAVSTGELRSLVSVTISNWPSSTSFTSKRPHPLVPMATALPTTVTRYSYCSCVTLFLSRPISLLVR